MHAWLLTEKLLLNSRQCSRASCCVSHTCTCVYSCIPNSTSCTATHVKLRIVPRAHVVRQGPGTAAPKPLHEGGLINPLEQLGLVVGAQNLCVLGPAAATISSSGSGCKHGVQPDRMPCGPWICVHVPQVSAATSAAYIHAQLMVYRAAGHCLKGVMLAYAQLVMHGWLQGTA